MSHFRLLFISFFTEHIMFCGAGIFHISPFACRWLVSVCLSLSSQATFVAITRMSAWSLLSFYLPILLYTGSHQLPDALASGLCVLLFLVYVLCLHPLDLCPLALDTHSLCFFYGQSEVEGAPWEIQLLLFGVHKLIPSILRNKEVNEGNSHLVHSLCYLVFILILLEGLLVPV